MAKYSSIRQKLIALATTIISAATIAFVVLSVLQVTVSGVQYFLRVKKNIQASVIDKGMTLVINNGLALRGMAEDNAYSAIREIVASTVKNDTDMVYGIYMDKLCQEWVHASRENLSGRVAVKSVLCDSISMWAHGLNGATYKVVSSGRGRDNFPDLFEFAAPVISGSNEKIGYIRYGISTMHARTVLLSEKRRMIIYSGVFLAAFCVVAMAVLLMGFRLAKRQTNAITKPIEELTNAATGIARGDYSHQVSSPSDDEIGTLARNFEIMRSTVKEYTEQLENKVEQRTAELRSMMNNLGELKDRAEAATMAKSQFLANMSHEIRTPMNAVIGFSEMLRSTPLTGQQIEYVNAICESGELLISLMDDILDLSKIESHKIRLEDIDFDLEQCISGILKILRQRVGNKPVDVELVYPDGVPRFVKGDPTRIRQIFMNLVGNAVKFTDEGGITVRVGLNAADLDKGNNKLKFGFSVKDTGIGIPLEKQREIFESFTQVDSSITRKYGGTGLGLAITKSLVEQMGGEILVRSAPGKGTEFLFHVLLNEGRPVIEESAAPRASDRLKGRYGDNGGQRQIMSRHATGGMSAKDVSVLVVEDNSLNQKVMGILLKQIWCSFEMAGNGREAIEKVRTISYDLILMDVQMPVMDGLAATAIIRGEIKSTTPIIALTAHVFQEDQQKCLAAGMNDFLAKPVTIEALREKIAGWIKK